MSSFDELHLSVRAVEWLRDTRWPLVKYRHPVGLPACWGAMHTKEQCAERGFKVPEDVTPCPECKGKRRVQAAYFEREYDEDGEPEYARPVLRVTDCAACKASGLALPKRMLVGVVDVRAIVRSRTPGASGLVWYEDRHGQRKGMAPRTPTCSLCAVIFDEELTATKQRWELMERDENGEWVKVERVAPFDVEFVKP